MARSCAARDRGAAFSLIEILVTVALLSVIILGLVTMYDRTQSVFKSGLTQTDVMEQGRALAELLARELEQVSPASISNVVNFRVDSPPVAPLAQTLVGTVPAQQRTNVLQETFFVTEENRLWTAIGYRVSNPLAGAGSLYRFQSPAVRAADLPLMYDTFISTDLTNLSRVADGIVHFRVRAFDPHGQVIGYTNGVKTLLPAAGTIGSSQGPTPNDANLAFLSNAVPARIELELGILEPRAMRELQVRPTTMQRQYLAGQASAVHLFRVRAPVRNVDPAAYP